MKTLAGYLTANRGQQDWPSWVKPAHTSPAEDDTRPIMCRDGSLAWLDQHRLFHRVNGPAVCWPGGVEEWYRHGLRHHTDGPAKHYPDRQYLASLGGTQFEDEYWLEGRRVNEEDLVPYILGCAL